MFSNNKAIQNTNTNKSSIQMNANPVIQVVRGHG